MLVHKQTHGVLQNISVTNNKGKWSIKTNLKLKMFPELRKDEWWEVQDNTVLGRKIMRSYPDFIPIESDGQLIDITPIVVYTETEEEITHRS